MLISSVERWVIGVVAVIVMGAGLYLTGYARGHSASEKVWKAEKALMKAQADAERTRLIAEGKELAAQLKVAQANVRIEYREVIRYVTRFTSPTRRALSADAVRVLNTSPGIESPAPESVIATDPKAATNPGGASERAVAEWIANASAMYEECRLQANALIDYVKARE